ncbi:TPA: hypothetical protein ACMDXH_000736 [Vibrio parahaemolyticus]|nr:hypothetical protein [Vibrio parahaemolyticus]EHY8553040.1 hypothetical protein [Vibrio parahaemolyticus]EIA9327219.1 hypothetical protein [Vibrio parahaemolyticus]EJV9414063.1 hypothetical protein [Vibrio vulnificus]
MKTFKEHLKEQVIDELMVETNLLDVQVLFPEIKLEQLGVGNDGQRFRLTATTNKGTKIQNELGLSELLSVGYVRNLVRASYS